ncbi:uncharacterized protein LOC142323149 [Lycorma delicatula]|uniref:uncharacterized protein LOC142323149 n=1 Tax=Lycorma delicatula TaxID=130591 RepID=UPI003F50E398
MAVPNTEGTRSHKLRKDFYVSLIGYIFNQIVGTKLPLNRQVLSVLFYNKNLIGNAGKEKEKDIFFVEIMDDLFDISHSNALEQMKSDDDKNFLLLQRQKGRPGSKVGVEQRLKHKQKKH